MVVQPQRGLQGGDQAGPFLLVRERGGADQHAAAGDLFAPDPGEQTAAFDVDAGVDERRGQMLGEVLQVVGHVRERTIAQLTYRHGPGDSEATSHQKGQEASS